MCIAQGVSAEDALKLCNQQFDGILPKASFVTKFKVTKSGKLTILFFFFFFTIFKIS